MGLSLLPRSLPLDSSAASEEATLLACSGPGCKIAFVCVHYISSPSSLRSGTEVRGHPQLCLCFLVGTGSFEVAVWLGVVCTQNSPGADVACDDWQVCLSGLSSQSCRAPPTADTPSAGLLPLWAPLPQMGFLPSDIPLDYPLSKLS